MTDETVGVNQHGGQTQIGYAEKVYILTERETILPDEPEGPVRNPYKGLRPFTYEDKDDFFGRDALVQELLDRFVSPEQEAPAMGDRCLAVVGPSGSGKSSVVRAGLIPALARVTHVTHWTVVQMTPGERPIEILATQLRAAENLQHIIPSDLIRELRSEDGRGLHRLAESALTGQSPNARLFLFVDQFEELYTQTSDKAERDLFIRALLAAVQDDAGRTVLVLTLRADFYGRLIEHAILRQWIPDRRQVNVGPMTLPELRSAIEAPAKRVGLAFEGSLVERILGDVGDEPGALPLLEHTLYQLYRESGGKALTNSAYDALGGVQGALTRTADQTYEAMPPDQQRVLRAALLRLVTLGDEQQVDTRRRVGLKEIRPAEGEPAPLEAALNAFVNHRLLTAYQDSGASPSYEVSHEALIGHWPRFQAWLEESRARLQLHRRFEQEARLWNEEGRHVEYLAPRLMVERLQVEIAAQELNDLEQTYLDASLAELAVQRARDEQIAQRVRNRERVSLVFGLMFLLAAGAILLAMISLSQVQIERAAVEAQSTYFALEQGRSATLAAGGVILPLPEQTQIPQAFASTLTQVAVLHTYPTMLATTAALPPVDMVRVPAGCFMMGSIFQTNEQPIHEVCFENTFWLDRFEVTYAAYQAFIDAGGYEDDRYWIPDIAGRARPEGLDDFCLERTTDPQQPVGCASWYEAAAYCVWRGARLPTEAEWEYAARGPDSLVYPWGNAFVDENLVWSLNSLGFSRAVGPEERAAGMSWVGAYDLSGNVWEWVADWYGKYPAGEGRVVNPNGPEEGVYRVRRGGSWGDDAADSRRSAFRRESDPGQQLADTGFRCARSE